MEKEDENAMETCGKTNINSEIFAQLLNESFDK